MATKIRGAQINNAIAGAGLELTASGVLNILVDDSSIEINVDTLQVKAGGISNTMLENDSVTITAGDALSGGGEVDLGGTIELDVVADGTTISVAGDQLSVIASGIDHGSISGLADDDHTQYILADGTRAFSGIFESVGMELTEGDVKLFSAPAASGVSGITASGTTSATFGQAVYVDASGEYVAAKADSGTTMPAVALSTGAGNEVINQGFITDPGWSWTPGGLIYVSDGTAGDLTQTAPTASGSQVQVIGVATSATTIYLDPDLTFMELGDPPYYTKSELTTSGVLDVRYYTETEVDAMISGAVASGVLDHGNLAGLADDDHTQYLLANGDRALSGDLWPDASGTVDLGSATYPYAEIYVDDIYVKGASIYLGGYEISEFSNDETLIDESANALPTEYAVKTYADTLTATISGDIMQEVSDNYIDNSEMTTISGDILQFVSDNYIDNSEMTTISGDILQYVSDNYIDNSEMTTISGDILQYVSDNYIDNSEMTTISGDIISYVDNEIVWEVVDTPTNRIQPKAAHMGLPVYIADSLTVGGNLTVTGTTFYTETEEVLVSDNFIYINYGEPGSGVTSVTAGIDVDRGGFPSYVFAFDERNDTFRVGVSGSQDDFNDYPLQPVATREDSPTDTRVPWWDAASYTFRTQGDTYITLNSGTDQITLVRNNETAAWFSEDYIVIGPSGTDAIEIRPNSHQILFTVNGPGGGAMNMTLASGGLSLDTGAIVNEILDSGDSISSASTDSQLATAKLIYNTLSGTIIDGSLTGGTPTYMYYVGADGMPATTVNMTYNNGTGVIHLGEPLSKGIDTFVDIDTNNNVVAIEALSTFSVTTTSGYMSLAASAQYFGAQTGPRLVTITADNTAQFQLADASLPFTIGADGMSLLTGASVTDITDTITSPGDDDTLATEKAIVDYVDSVSGAVLHNNRSDLQGGNDVDEYYHLDLTAFTALSGVDDTQVGQWDTAYSHTLLTNNPHSVTYSQVGAIQNSTDTVKDTHIDWGSGANQVDLDDVPDGTSYERVAANQLNSGIYINATDSVKGIASFSTDNFLVTSGVVTVKDDGIAEPELVIANSPIDGYYLQYTTASGMQWTDVSTQGVLESDFQLDNLSDDCDGVETQFYLSYVPVANSLQVYLNGLLQEKGGGKDYTNTTSGVLFTTAPLTGDILIANYVRASA